MTSLNPPTQPGAQFQDNTTYLQGTNPNQTSQVRATVTSPVRQFSTLPPNNNYNAATTSVSYVDGGLPSGQRFVSTGQMSALPLQGNTVRSTVVSNQVGMQGAYLPAGSQIGRGTYQTVVSGAPSIYKSALRETQTPIQVFTATGPPLPPVQSTSTGWRQTQSLVRPVTSVIVNEPIIQATAEPTKVATQQPVIITQPPVQGPTIVESVVRERHDPQRDSRVPLYQGSGYKDSKKGTPCCLALLGLLALAGLLTGLFFLIRAINAGAGGSAQARAPVNYKQNATSTNSTSNTSVIVIPGNTTISNSTNLSPIVIDVNTNPAVNKTNTTNTSGSTVTVISVPTTTTTTTTTTGGTTTTTGGSTGTTTTSTTGTTTTGTSTAPPITTTGTIIPSSATVLTPEQIAADPNALTISNYLRTQDAIRLGQNPTLQGIATSTVNGVKTYYYSFNNNAGKNYLYGVVMGPNGQPSVKTVSVTLDSSASTATVAATSNTTTTTTTARHQLNPVRQSHKLRTQYAHY